MLRRGKSANYFKRAILVFATLLLMFFVNFPLHAQESQMADLSLQVASALEKANIKGKVVVLDFSGPGLEVTQFGRNLANQLSDALPRSKKFELVERDKMLEELKKNDPSFLTSSDIDPGQVLQLTRAGAEIVGHLENDSDSFALKLEIRRVKKMKTVAKLAESLPTSADTEAQVSTVLSSSKYADAEAVGYTRPDCIHCPTPPYTDAALHSRSQGAVILSVIIEPDGRAHEITVSKHLRADLEESAIKTVGQWAFKPATGPDGKPAAVKMLIEIDFHLY